MKFRTSFQVSRQPTEDGARPRTASHFKMHSLFEKPSKASLANGPNEHKEEPKNTPTRKAMQEFLQKTGANLKATGAKLERRVPRRKSKVVCGLPRGGYCAYLTLNHRSSLRPNATAESKSKPSISTTKF